MATPMWPQVTPSEWPKWMGWGSWVPVVVKAWLNTTMRAAAMRITSNRG